MKKVITSYLSGRVTATVIKGSLPRLMTELMKTVDIIAASSDSIMLRARDYKHIRPAARRSGCLVRATRKWGLGFDLRRRRLALPFAALCIGFCMAAAVMSDRIIAVEVPPTAAPRAEIIELLRQNGVRFGASRSSVDERAVGRELIIKYPKLSYAALNTAEWRAVLNTRAAYPAPPSRVPDGGTVLVSKYDAVVTEVRVTGGAEQVVKGQVVAKGQLLAAAGVTPNTSSWAAGASGSVTGLITERLELCLGRRAESLVKNGRVFENRYLCAFGGYLPLDLRGEPSTALLSSRTEQLTLFGVELPFEMKIVTATEAISVVTPYNAGNLAFYAERAVRERISADYPAATLHRIDCTYAENDRGWFVTAEILLETVISDSILP